jgi:WD40 repeat protein/serine/threonine protein kinase
MDDDERQTAPKDRPRLPPGMVVDHFKVLRLLGKGGMSEVYLARDIRLGRKVALKLILGGEATPRLKRLFRAEAQATASFSHPNIVTIFHVGDHDGSPYLALEYLEGETLAARTRRERLGEKEMVRIALEISQALREAHSHGILHRDLKPENVVITSRGRTKVLDFGLAMTIQDRVEVEEPAPPEEPAPSAEPQGDPASLQAGVTERTIVVSSGDGTAMEVKGTPFFMAPEQWRREETTGAIDIWALGMILYQTTTGRRPYLVSTIPELATAVTGPAPVPLKPVEETAPSLRDLIGRCLEKDPTRRPDVDEVVAQLESMLEGGLRNLPSDTCPFRGLRPFTEEHAALFFGRESEVTACVERLRQQPVLAVVGPSGAGKSSFVQAGVVPRLREQGPWVVLALRPATTPFEHLASAVLEAEARFAVPSSDPTIDVSEEVPEAPMRLSRALHDNPGLLGLRLQRLALQGETRVLLFVDQLEELYTLTGDEEVRRRYMRAVCCAADDAESWVRVVFTLRDDSLGRVAEEAEAQEALGQITLLRSPGRDALNEILVRPLEAVSYAYDDPGIVEEMLAEVRGEPACLPLLQFATRMLWERRDSTARLLLRSVYEAMGGVGGALAEQADAVITDMGPAQEALARQVLLRLVTPEGTRRVRSYGELLDGLGPGAEDVLQRLVGGRLVTMMRGHGADLPAAEVELVHESLIRVWGRLARWINESHEELAFLAELRQAAELWERRGEREDEVWHGDALREASRWLSRASTAVPEVVRRFHKAGLDQEESQRRSVHLRRLGVTATMVMVTVVSLVAAWAYSEKERQAEMARDRAVLRRAQALREGARAALGRGALIDASSMLRVALEARDSAHSRALWHRLRRHPLAWQRKLGAYIYRVDFSPDGTKVAAACQDRSIYLFDTRTQQVRFLRGHSDQILGMAFSPTGRHIASGTWSGEVFLWHLPEGRYKALPGHRKVVWSLSFSPDGKWLATASMDGTVHVFDVTTARKIRELKGRGFMSVAFSPDGKRLAAGGVDGEIHLWSFESGEKQFVLHGGSELVSMIDFNPDGQTLAASSHDQKVRVWDLRSRKPVRVLTGVSAAYNTVRFSPDGRWLALGTNQGTIHLWEVERGWRRYRLDGHTGTVYGLAFSPDSRLLGSGSTDKSIRVWRLTPEALVTEAPHSHDGLIYGVAFSPDGRRVASGGRDGKILLWDLERGRPKRVLSAPSAVFGVAFSPDGKLLASAQSKGTVELWSLVGSARRRTIAAELEVSDVAFSPDGRQLAAGSQYGRVWLWDVASGRLRWEGRHKRPVYGVSFSADGKLLATGSFDKTVGLWETATGKRRLLQGHESGVFGVAFTKDGRVVSGSGDGTVRLWDRTGASRVVRRISTRIYNIGVSPDGQWVGAPSSNQVAHLWPLSPAATGEIVLRGHRGEVNFLDYSPDGKLVVTSSDDETVRVWEARTGRPYWRAPVLLIDRPLLLSHRGWRDLVRDAAVKRPAGAWVKAVEERARLAAVADDGTLCIHAEDDRVEVWDRASDRRLSTLGARRIVDLVALPGGCLALSRDDSGGAGPALLIRPSGAPRQLAAQATAVAWDHGSILAATGREVLTFDADGRRTATRPGRRGVRAMARVGEWVALGNQDGNIELLAQAGKPPSVYFEDVPSSPVVRLLEGPRGTLFAGFANGTVGLWSTLDGTILDKVELHGPIRHMVRKGTRLYVATELGDHTTIGLDEYLLGYCPLLRQVWSQVPVVWEDGQPRLRPAPGGHRCAAR